MLTFPFLGNGQDISAFDFGNVNTGRYGVTITNGDAPLQGLLELRSKGTFFRGYRDSESFIKTVWSEHIDIKPFQNGTFLLL